MARCTHAEKVRQGHETDPDGSPKVVEHEQDEIENTIQQLGSNGTSSSKIGMILRDRYGVRM